MAVRTDFVAGEVLAAQDLDDTFAAKVDYALPVNTQTGTTYTFVLADGLRLTTASNASASTFTVPPQSSVVWLANSVIRLVNFGAGVVTIDGGSGVTVTNTAKTLAQFESVACIRTASNAWTVVPFSSSGALAGAAISTTPTGNYTDGGVTYDFYTFNSSGSLAVSTAGLADVLVVGGGGSSGRLKGGGGGGGGHLHITNAFLPVGTATIVVGAGGVAPTHGSSLGMAGNNGIASSVAGYFSPGGGAGNDIGITTGNTYFSTPGLNGGSGGGAGGGDLAPVVQAGGAGISGLGSNGGSSNTLAGGGGGGASAVGSNATANNGGAGGAGAANSITGSAVTRAGGGGGGASTAGSGGAGGGGTSAAGAANSGGGGGASTTAGANGGSGVVIVRVARPNTPPAGAATISGTPTGTFTSGGADFAFFTFNSSGTLTVNTAGFADVLVVGGGGAGDFAAGGAGGHLHTTSVFLPSGSNTVTVGAGGAATNRAATNNGNASRMNFLYGVGGGLGGGSVTNGIGKNGGSGGGGSETGAGGAGTPGQGNNGGSGNGTNTGFGGGGGAGAVGSNALTSGSGTGGAGGAGSANSITGSAVTRAGGGGGGAAGTPGAGGSGGGGAGVSSGASNNGSSNSGGGGGGNYSTAVGGAGGSGVVIVLVRTA